MSNNLVKITDDYLKRKAKSDLKDRLAQFKFDKEKHLFMIDPNKSFFKNSDLMLEKVREYINTSISTASPFNLSSESYWKKIQGIGYQMHLYDSILHRFAANKIDDNDYDEIKKIFAFLKGFLKF